jgi:hypothetical protein
MAFSLLAYGNFATQPEAANSPALLTTLLGQLWDGGTGVSMTWHGFNKDVSWAPGFTHMSSSRQHIACFEPMWTLWTSPNAPPHAQSDVSMTRR